MCVAHTYEPNLTKAKHHSKQNATALQCVRGSLLDD